MSQRHDAFGSDEQALVARLRAGDAAAFEHVVRTHTPRLLAVCRRFLPEEADALDAVQDAYCSAVAALPGFAGDAALGTWLHAIAVRACLMKLRTRRRRPEAAIEDLLPAFAADGHRARPGRAWSDDPVGELAERDEHRALVRDCIARLPETYRTVLLLRDIEEYDTREAAALLGVSEAVVKTRLHRARQALRTLLDPYFGGGA